MHGSSMQWIGRTLTGTYKIESPLGDGGQGVVFRGRNVRTEGAVAIKILSERIDNTVRRRFREEARTAARLCHPNIVHVIDSGEDSGFFYLVMELLGGVDLFHSVERNGPLPLAQVVTLAREIGSALDFAHKSGVVHRDIKPQNICFANRSIGGKPFPTAKILDFGVSRAPRTTQITPEHALIGTPHYMSPEAALGRIGQVDALSDLWSLAVVLYYALSARMPFPAPDVMSTLYAIIHRDPVPLDEAPASVWHVLLRALAKQRDERFQSVDEFVTAFCLAADLENLGWPTVQPMSSFLRVATPIPMDADSRPRMAHRGLLAAAAAGATATLGCVWLFAASGLGAGGVHTSAQVSAPLPASVLAGACVSAPSCSCAADSPDQVLIPISRNRRAQSQNLPFLQSASLAVRPAISNWPEAMKPSSQRTAVIKPPTVGHDDNDTKKKFTTVSERAKAVLAGTYKLGSNEDGGSGIGGDGGGGGGGNGSGSGVRHSK